MPPFDPLLDDEDEDDQVEAPPPDRRLTTSEQKLQRWVDLLAALLVRQRPAPFEELVKDVPGYDAAHGKHESVMRTFERDKDELRRFGVPIDTVKDANGDPIGYVIDRRAFYLPYLHITGAERTTSQAQRRPHGYRHLELLAFEPDELDAIVEAAARVRLLGDPVLAKEADEAVRKLSLDLPLGAVLDAQSPSQVSREGRPVVVQPRAQADASVFERLSDALARRKVVTFEYFTMERGEKARRTVEPYGLFFISSHWYLAGRDRDRDAVRNFRLSRISGVEVNPKRAQSADYAIPEDFVLREHAQAREAWEIGDGRVVEATVEFVAATGLTQAALHLGQPVDGHSMRRRFTVRRTDAFARWLLSFGSDARVIQPPELQREYADLVRATRALYEGNAGASSVGDRRE